MSTTSRARILIADDHVMVAAALKQLLASDFEVLATVHDGRSLVLAAQTLSPDVVLVDVSMPLLNGLDAAERIKRSSPVTKIIYVTVNHDPDLAAESLRRGADGYILKSCAASELISAIHQILRGDCHVSAALGNVSERQPMSASANSSDKLTDRQIDVLQLLAEGRSMKEVASVLNLTTRTVAFHKYRLMSGLGLRNDAEIVQYAVRKNMLAA
ncbi:MAG TPA: response regulator transcription factor [Terriglobales bacterium]|jgi:DNA-binding NarL/FixJ family response regulator|nr:response regulator transcription factor [Terriglobales bacterium]